MYVRRNYSNKKIIQLIIILLVAFTIVKYHKVYNSKRKFMDLQHADLSRALNAGIIDHKLNGLKWISPYYSENPEEEVRLLKDIIKILKRDNRKKMVITHYQFLSLILEQDLNIPNRWNLYHDNIYPIKDNQYVEYYKEFFNKNIKSNKIKVIYIIKSKPDENINIEQFRIHLGDVCIKTEIFNELTSAHEIGACN